MYSLGDKYDLPGLKKEVARRFEKDVEIPGDGKRETMTLLSVVPAVYSTTPDNDRCLRDLIVRQIFQRDDIASKHFVEELDTALEFRHFARDMLALQSKKPLVDYAALAKDIHRIWHRCVEMPLGTATSSLHIAARSSARIVATGITHPTALNIFWNVVAWFAKLIIVIMVLMGPCFILGAILVTLVDFKTKSKELVLEGLLERGLESRLKDYVRYYVREHVRDCVRDYLFP